MEINPHILIYGEGWNMNTPIPEAKKAIIANSHKLPGIGFFNDRFRDYIKGHTFVVKNRGYALGNFIYSEQVRHLLAGSMNRSFFMSLTKQSIIWSVMII